MHLVYRVAREIVFQPFLQTLARCAFFFSRHVTVARATSLFMVVTHVADCLDHGTER